MFVVGPFIISADDDTIRRLRASTEFLTPQIPGIVLSHSGIGTLVEFNGKILNAMIHRSSHLGLRPVLKALYSIYRRTLEIQGVSMHFRIPDELLTAIGATLVNIEHEAMDQLSLAIRRHREVLQSPFQRTIRKRLSLTSVEA